MNPLNLKNGDPIPTELLCPECTGDGLVHGFAPCKVCSGHGYVMPVESEPVKATFAANTGRLLLHKKVNGLIFLTPIPFII